MLGTPLNNLVSSSVQWEVNCLPEEMVVRIKWDDVLAISTVFIT